MVLAALWAVAASAVAMLPMRLQMLPGLALLMSAPVVIGYLGLRHGWIAAALAILALLSMFRRPLGYLLRRLRGPRR
ncbi:DUF2484 family protein [Pseudodonghicola flavimaris]|uniref:DUF2484 family protein n=1 Tax=Pseudodonghicola flavimaris TaxID=3050036 RepID=A0ABT7F062_9RHOB|nr:DUF2484 family protein [Pseudodonghicola flavimaris]MDK3017980.1 DUF2484 family protein [Pseudodonghicola flavimaris]